MDNQKKIEHEIDEEAENEMKELFETPGNKNLFTYNYGNFANHNCTNNFVVSTNSSKKNKDLLRESCIGASVITIKCAIYDCIITNPKNQSYNILSLMENLEKILILFSFIEQLRQFINDNVLPYCQVIKSIRLFKDHQTEFENYLLKDDDNFGKFMKEKPIAWDPKCLLQFLKFSIFRNKIKNGFQSTFQDKILQKIIEKKINGLEFFSFNNDQLLKFSENSKTYLIFSKISNEITIAYYNVDKEKILIQGESNNDEIEIRKIMENMLNNHYFQLFDEIIKKLITLSPEKEYDLMVLENNGHSFLLQILKCCEKEMRLLKNKYVIEIMRLFHAEENDRLFFESIVKQIMQHDQKKDMNNNLSMNRRINNDTNHNQYCGRNSYLSSYDLDNTVMNIFSFVSTKIEFNSWSFLTNLKYGKNNEFELLNYVSECCIACWKITFIHEDAQFFLEKFIKTISKNKTIYYLNDNIDKVNVNANINDNDYENKENIKIAGDCINCESQCEPQTTDSKLKLKQFNLHSIDINKPNIQNKTNGYDVDKNIELESMRVEDLKKILKMLGLPVGGKKVELINRLKKSFTN